ncbi:MAG: phosphotransferase [Anaerolineae bacterium]|nr:phosphotransferase [Anaerolineae bacterium]
MDTANLVLAAYDLVPPVTVEALDGGINNATRLVKTGAGDFVWRQYRAQRPAETLLYEHRLLAWLTHQTLSFGVPIPLASRTGLTLVETTGVYHALFTRLPGHRPDDANPVHVQAIGRGLGELQAVLARYPLDPRPGLFSYRDLERVHPRLAAPDRLTPADLGLPDTASYADDLAWWRDEVAALRTWTASHYAPLPRQVVHGDFDGSNTLVKGDHVTGILDFEFAMPDARAIDVASGLMFSMRTWENPTPWPAADAFCQGYRAWIHLTPAEVAALPWLMRLRNAVSTVWWLGRGLAEGGVLRSFGRIEWIRETVTWLAAHGTRLQAAIIL